jgi:hypothetical protein
VTVESVNDTLHPGHCLCNLAVGKKGGQQRDQFLILTRGPLVGQGEGISAKKFRMVVPGIVLVEEWTRRRITGLRRSGLVGGNSGCLEGM